MNSNPEGLVEKIKTWWSGGEADDLRTSDDHRLIISYASIGDGLIGMTICPGRKGDSASGSDWDRDLETDLNDIKEWGAGMVVSLLDDEELAAAGGNDFGAALRAKGMDWVSVPMPASGLPDARSLDILRRAAPEIHRVLDSKKSVLIHCMDGFTRSGLVAALLFTQRGDTAAGAISRIRDIRPGVFENPEQEEFIYREAALEGPQSGKILSSLFGGAIGDALGAEIEFMSLSEISAIFPQGVDRILPHDGQVGSITDDTQMTMFTAEGLIRSCDRGTNPVEEVHQALLRWMVTQGHTAPERFDTTGLAQDVRLNKQRAPGMTCTSALCHPNGLGQPADNDSKGCGTIMRVAPIALMGGDQIEDIAKRTSALTHGHTTGQEAAAAWALILFAVMNGADPEAAATDQIGKFGPETSEAIHAALRAKRDGRPETVESLGGGWIAEEALAIALYATLSANNFEHGLQIAVTHSGDSDSTGAIAGNLLGLVYPGQVMASPWRRQIECPDLISRIAQEIDRCALSPAG